MKSKFWIAVLFSVVSLTIYAKDILILNSYSYSFPQTKEVMNGITDGLLSEEANLDIHIEYMDSRKIRDKENHKKLYEVINQKYKTINFSLVVCADIEALRFAKSHRDDFFNNIPIIYTGIENIDKSVNNDVSTFSGVSETGDYDALFDFFKKRYKNQKIVLICDSSETGLNQIKKMGEFSLKKGLKTFHIGRKERNLAELTKNVEKFGKEAVFVVGFFSGFSTGEKINSEDIIAELSKEGYHVYGTYRTHLGAGIIGGVLFDRYSQGKKSAELIKDILQNDGVSKKRVTVERKILYFDYTYMKKGGLSITDAPLGSKYINYTSFYSKYKGVLDTAVLFFIFLSGILIMLAFYLVKTKMLNKEILENNRFIKIIIDSFPSMLSIIDNEGNIVWANNEFEKIFGAGKNTDGKSFFELICLAGVSGKDIKKYLEDDYEAIQKFEPRYGVEEKLRFSDGTVRWYYTNKIPLELKGKKEFLMRLSIDMTERKAIEVDLKNAKEKAETANESKSRFLANISHEIRTPLNSIIGMADILKHEAIPATNKKQADIIAKSSERLLVLINDILDLSRIEAGVVNVDFSRFNLRDELRKNVEIMYSKALKKNIDVIFAVRNDVPNEIITDKTKYMQIFTNITANAIKFTTKGYVYIRIAYEKRDDQYILKATIEDSGIGIPDNEKDNIFKKFARADETYSSKFEGSGLGLTIAQELVELLGGKMAFVSKVGVGTKFTFEIPVKIGEEKDEQNYENTVILTCFKDKKKNEAVAFAFSEIGPEIYTSSEEEEYKLLYSELSEEKYTIIGAGEFEKEIEGDIIINYLNNSNYSEARLFDTTIIERKLEGYEEAHKVWKIEQFQEKLEILVVEDNEFNRETFGAILGKMGDFGIDFAFDGFKCIEKIDRKRYNIIFSDIQLPGMDGFELAARIKQNENNDTVPLIAVTAHAVEGFKEKCIRAGFDDYISKPVTIDKIHNVIKKWIRKYPDNLEERIKGLYNSSEFNQKISSALIRSVKTSCEIIANAIKENNMEEVKKEAHKMKGAAGTIKYDKLRHTLAELEKYAEAEDIDTVAALFKKVDEEAARIEELIDGYGITI